MARPKRGSHGLSQGMVITVVIQNSSDAELVIGQASLTGGNWQGAAPQPGQILAAGANTYVDVTQSIFAAAGGYISLLPASGGSVALSWNWKPQTVVTANGFVLSNASLTLVSDVSNPSTYNPTVNYIIADAGYDDIAGDLACPPANME